MRDLRALCARNLKAPLVLVTTCDSCDCCVRNADNSLYDASRSSLSDGSESSLHHGVSLKPVLLVTNLSGDHVRRHLRAPYVRTLRSPYTRNLRAPHVRMFRAPRVIILEARYSRSPPIILVWPMTALPRDSSTVRETSESS